jgi:hypothetical protein
MNNSLLFNDFQKQKIKYITQPNYDVGIINKIPKVKDFIVDDLQKKHIYFNDKLNENNLHSINTPYNSESIIVNEKKQRVNRILIDSVFRNKIPKNILDIKYFNILTNSINLYSIENTSGYENILRIIFKNNLNINDRIILQNLKSTKIQLKNPISMTNTNPYIKILHQNHGLKKEYIKYNPIYINISNIIGNSADKKYLNNIPITEINRKHLIYLTLNESEIVNADYYYIKLDVIPQANYVDNINIAILEINSLYGVPLNLINSNYPLNDNQLIGYHTIINATTDYIDIQLTTNIPLTVYNIGSKFIISKVLNTIDSYPNNNQYSVTLNKTLYNVSSIKLINAYFPISSYLIKTDINDKLYWQISNDSDYIYSIKIYQNNYEPDILAKIIEDQINNTTRISITKTYLNDNLNSKIYFNNKHISKVSINKLNNLTEIKMYQEVILYDPFTITIDDIGFKYITINYLKHELTINDTIEIFEALSTDGIPSELINKEHNIYKIIDENNIQIKIPIHNPNTTIEVKGYVKIRKPILFRLLFNYTDTIGKVIGFRNTGDSKSITSYKSIIRNDEPYEQDFIYDEEGNTILDKSNSIIPNHNVIFSNKYHYILLCSNILESRYDGDTLISGVSPHIKNVLAKVDFDNDIGKYVYETYTNFIDKLSINIPQLTTIDFSIYYSDGTLYDSNTLEHSFVLEIIEDLNELINSKSNTRQGI